jgi:hypothetical protein
MQLGASLTDLWHADYGVAVQLRAVSRAPELRWLSERASVLGHCNGLPRGKLLKSKVLKTNNRSHNAEVVGSSPTLAAKR